MSWSDRLPRIESAIAAIWLVAVLATFSDAGVPFPTFVVMLFATLALAGWCLLRLVLILVRWRSGDTELRRGLRSWVLVPAVLAVGFLAAVSPVFLACRVYLSSGALLDRASALSAIAPDDLYLNGRWVGLFRVRQFSQYGNELRFITNSCGLVDSCGLVYAPDGRPQTRGEDSFSHLYGHWWQLYESF